jgi:hypothetical protein
VNDPANASVMIRESKDGTTAGGPPTGKVIGRRLWALFMIARTPETGESILRSRPVIARNLDAEALRRALRGGPLPNPDAFVVVSNEQLDAIAEAGPLNPAPRKKR